MKANRVFVIRSLLVGFLLVVLLIASVASAQGELIEDVPCGSYDFETGIYKVTWVVWSPHTVTGNLQLQSGIETYDVSLSYVNGYTWQMAETLDAHTAVINGSMKYKGKKYPVDLSCQNGDTLPQYPPEQVPMLTYWDFGERGFEISVFNAAQNYIYWNNATISATYEINGEVYETGYQCWWEGVNLICGLRYWYPPCWPSWEPGPPRPPWCPYETNIMTYLSGYMHLPSTSTIEIIGLVGAWYGPGFNTMPLGYAGNP